MLSESHADSRSDSAEPHAAKKGIRTAQSPGRGPKLLLGFALGLYTVCLATLSIANSLGPERWWWSTLNLYLPQWLWGIPGLCLLFVCLLMARRWTWLPLLLLLWVAGPLMGFRWSFFGHSPSSTHGRRLRILTYNIKWRKQDPAASLRQIRDAHPDVLVLQDAGSSMEDGLRALLPGWQFDSYDQYVIGRRPPILLADLQIYSYPGTPGNWLRCRLLIGSSPITVYLVHLITPRRGLYAVRHKADEGIEDVEGDTSARLEQAQTLANNLRAETGPVIVAGDLNAPVQSLVCRALTDTGLRDAFDVAGSGYGYTYGHTSRFRHSYMRIDHILLSRRWQALSCRTGDAEGSDHRPVIADLFLPDGS